jgi:protocatechuate 3,4-dioxygenase alpha subunit
MRRLVTTVFFPGFEAANAADPVLAAVPEALRPLLVAVGEAEGRYRFDVLLRGPAETETPFFLD